ncbi:MAG: NAD-dependent epimerase/dehydratase family protein [Rubrobacteraceae bacterium]
MRSLVIGGGGFIGANLVERLLEKGHYVRIYGRNPSRFRGRPPGAEFVEGELGNHGLIRNALEGTEIVFHLVSTTLPKTSNDDPVFDVRSNLVDTVQLLEACVETGVRKVVFPSSGGTVYGPPKFLPVTEEHPTEPISSYGIVKLTVEKYLNLFHHLHGLDYAALRISNAYGPCQDPAGQQGAISVFLERARQGQPITVWGDGGAVRDFLYVSDLMDALELAAEKETKHKVFNVGSGRGVSVHELLDSISEATSERPMVEYLPARALDVHASVLDVSRAERELGWRPRTDLPEGISLTWTWLQTLPDPREETP